uniref:Tumor necrosis factor receptor-associated factor-like protein n=1 Tax=Rhipicephalus microplus TaxID=6941 RepID=A0A0B4PLV9_RHIMP|nr:Tumor necrosis factor receptor-associated factor-like protein [Rhipicephalus microplus]
MVLANQQYTLVGFTEDLDWNPLQFVNALPKNRLCSLCGLVRKTTALLPCGHVACSFCYAQCKVADGHVCPIDGQNCPEEDVEWRDFSAENLLNREVKCWNQQHGCTLVMAASEVPKHFHRECEYHITTCPRCSATVLCRDMGEHARASCNGHAAPREMECEEKLGHAVVAEILEGVRRAVQEQAQEMKELLERACGENGTLISRLSEVSQSVNSLMESVRQGIAPVGEISGAAHHLLNGVNTLRDVVSDGMSAIKKQNGQLYQVRVAIEGVKKDAGASTKKMLEMQERALAHADRNETRCDFIVPVIGWLQAKAMKDGASEYVHKKRVYLRGYNISPGVMLKKSGENVLLGMRLKLNKGDYDDHIAWPFQHKIRFTILHPDKGEDKEVVHNSCRTMEALEKSALASNQFAWFEAFDLGDLKKDGYVHNDTLRITWEIL